MEVMGYDEGALSLDRHFYGFSLRVPATSCRWLRFLKGDVWMV